jgi:hypothetical protein
MGGLKQRNGKNSKNGKTEQKNKTQVFFNFMGYTR